MKLDYTNSFILNSLNLPVIRDLSELSFAVGISKSMLYLLSKNSKAYYKTFTITKKSGSPRTINSPVYSLKHVQRWILEEILEKIAVTNESMAFRKGVGHGIKKNAEHHQYSLYLLQFDLEDFFTNIKKDKVYYIFKNLGYNSYTSNILTNLCVYDDYLPQGGVTSPYISNLICYKLDKRLKGLCSKRDILYTRYADDLTFSCDNKLTLKKIKKVIEEIIYDEGFKVNVKKTRLLSPSSHKKVTGLTVNDGAVKANKKLKRKVRAMIHHSILTENYSNNNQIIGYIAYINFIEPGYQNRIKKYIKNTIMKDYTKYKEVVNSFNANKLYKDVDDMVFDRYYEQEYLEDEDYVSLDMKEQFLLAKGYIEFIPEIENPFNDEKNKKITLEDLNF